MKIGSVVVYKGEHVNSKTSRQFIPSDSQDSNGRNLRPGLQAAVDEVKSYLADGQWHVTMRVREICAKHGAGMVAVLDYCRCAVDGRYICIDKGPGITPEIPPAYMASEQ